MVKGGRKPSYPISAQPLAPPFPASLHHDAKAPIEFPPSAPCRRIAASGLPPNTVETMRFGMQNSAWQMLGVPFKQACVFTKALPDLLQTC